MAVTTPEITLRGGGVMAVTTPEITPADHAMREQCTAALDGLTPTAPLAIADACALFDILRSVARQSDGYALDVMIRGDALEVEVRRDNAVRFARRLTCAAEPAPPRRG